MKKIAALIFLALTGFGFSPVLRYYNKTVNAGTSPYRAESAAYAAEIKPFTGVYKKLNDYYIEFFEQNIVKKPVVTKYSKEELEKMANEYGVDFYKMRVMLVVEAIYEMNGVKKDMKDIKKMSLPELTKTVYEAKNKFFASLTPEEKAKYDAEYKQRKKAPKPEAAN
ncbi:MAG: hypothetical protein LBT30_05410 [Clostridiales bacterium]|jgi:ribosomal protein L29|nr:hypothetical protein [Clostridiales bacterium]